MLVTKCDICKKEIKGERVLAGIGNSFLASQSFCLKCGKPVADFFNKLNKKENVKRKRVGVLERTAK